VSRIVEAFAPARLGTGFRWLLASSWASNLGDGLELAAAPLLVASLTRDPRLVALATLLQRLPWLVFGLPAGVLADRLDRRLVVAVVDLTRAVMLGLLALSVLTHTVTVALVLVAMFLLGIAEVFADSASATLPPMLVPRADLALANGRIYAGFATVNQMVGPPVGAALFALAMPAPFAVQAVLVALGALLISRVRLPRDADAEADSDVAVHVERRPMRHDVAEGFRWAARHPAVRTLTLTIFIFNITFGAAWSILVLYAKERLGMGSVGFGLLATSAAVGGLVGTTSYGWITRRVSLGDLMKVGLVIETFTHLALALTTSPVLALGIFFVFGAHAFIWGTTSVTVRQRAVPQALQGRVGAVNGLGVYGGLVLGAALGGLIAGRWGITAPFWFAFVGSAVFVAAIWSQLRYIAHDDEPPPDAPPAELWPASVIEG
jgi:predicted MFS family arabinose efflux permease